MPVKSEAQRGFMGACANNKSRAKMKKKCPPKKVAKEYLRAKPAKKKLPKRVKRKTS